MPTEINWAQFNWADVAIVAIVAVSALWSLLRGFFKEAISLLGWFAAIWLALNFSAELAPRLTPWVQTPSLRLGIAFAGLMIATLVLSSVLGFVVGQLIEKTGLSPTDRLLGMVFGAARGAIVVVVVVMLAGLTPIPNDPWWRESTLIPYAQRGASELRAALPKELEQFFEPGSISAPVQVPAKAPSSAADVLFSGTQSN